MPVGESLLFFGFRDPGQDYLYEDELRGFEETGVVRVQAAPSRVPGRPKTYVQDRIVEESADIWRLMAAGAVIFVCGNASTMAPAVRRAFMDVFRKQTGTPAAEAEAWLAGLRAKQRYLEDIWGGSAVPAGPVRGRRPPPRRSRRQRRRARPTGPERGVVRRGEHLRVELAGFEAGPQRAAALARSSAAPPWGMPADQSPRSSRPTTGPYDIQRTPCRAAAPNRGSGGDPTFGVPWCQNTGSPEVAVSYACSTRPPPAILPFIIQNGRPWLPVLIPLRGPRCRRGEAGR